MGRVDRRGHPTLTSAAVAAVTAAPARAADATLAMFCYLTGMLLATRGAPPA
jgi:hypothetical protein